MQTIEQFLTSVRCGDVEFEDAIGVIDAHYRYEPAAFRNGVGSDVICNAAGTNEGSCRIFAFAQQQKLSQAETLTCFGRFYREVLAEPEGTSHANIRRFMRDGWDGIHFAASPLMLRGSEIF